MEELIGYRNLKIYHYLLNGSVFQMYELFLSVL